MRIRMLTTAAGPTVNWPAGSVQVVDEALGQALVAGGYAEALPADVKPAQVIVHEATAPQTEERETTTAPAQRRRRTSKAKGKA